MGDILDRMRACIRNMQSGAWIEHMAELRMVPPDGVYVIMPWFQMSIHPLAQDVWEEPRVWEADEHQ
jgi:hypothetical protein